ncbi:MAG: hypothetical protein IPM91_18915 [Bacteroidetes bacterium]|nr:hypothetical protein [Bacteroidota bacterium]
MSICQGNSISLSSSATRGTYLWSNGATTKSINASTAGSYVVTVTGTNGCTTAANAVSVTVKVLPLQQLQQVEVLHFVVEEVLLNCKYRITYLWSNGATTKQLMHLQLVIILFPLLKAMVVLPLHQQLL